MFSQLFTVATILAAATSALAQSCSTGPIQCCDTVEKASDPAVAKMLGGLGVVVQDVNALVGITCTPVTVIGGSVSDQW